MATPRMFRLLGLLLAVFVLTGGTARADSVTIACYNLENFFDVFDNPYTQDETTDVKSREDIQQIAAAVRAMDADIVSFSEVENAGVLNAMVRELLPDMGYRYVAVSPTNSGRGINLGIISRLPIESITSYRFQKLHLLGHDRTWRFARDVPLFRVRIAPDKVMDIYAAHFKSKRDSSGDPDSSMWRRAEATRVWQMIDQTLEQDPEAWVVLMGDLNDTPNSLTLQTLQAAGVNGEPLLHDTLAGLPEEKRITYLRKPYRSQIDYILVSPALKQQLVPGSAYVLDDEALLQGSDHAPVSATFSWGDRPDANDASTASPRE